MTRVPSGLGRNEKCAQKIAGGLGPTRRTRFIEITKRSRPAFADRAWIQWQVGLTTVPAAATRVRFCRPLLPSWRVESSGVTGPQKQIRRSHRRHLPLRRIPTARLPEHGLRGSLDYEPHVYRGHGMWRGSGWPPTKGIQVIRCCKVLPPMPLPSMNRGGGGRGRRNIA